MDGTVLKHSQQTIPKGHGLHIAIVDCSSLIGSHFLRAAQDSTRIETITCFTSEMFPLITQCDKVDKVFFPKGDVFSFGNSWAKDMSEVCGHLDAVVLLFDDGPQYGGINNIQIKDSSLFDDPQLPQESNRIQATTPPRYETDWSPVYDISQAAYDKGASVCVWATLIHDFTTRDVDFFYNRSRMRDVVILHLSDALSYIVNDGKFFTGDNHYWQTNIYPHLYKWTLLRSLTGCVLLSQCAECALHWLLTSNAVLQEDLQLPFIQEHSIGEISDLGSLLDNL